MCTAFVENEKCRLFYKTKRRFVNRIQISLLADELGFIEGLAPFPIRVVTNLWGTWQGIHPRTFD